MAEQSFPFSGVTPGDAGPYSASFFAEVMRAIIGQDLRDDSSVNYYSGDGTNPALEVTETSPVSTQVRVRVGNAFVKGYFYSNDDNLNLTISSNNSGNPRIDTIALEVDFTAQEVRAIVVAGTPAGSPVAPTLTQDAAVWQVPIANIAVANLFVSIGTANIDNTIREYARLWDRQEGGIAPFDYADDEFLIGVNAADGIPIKGKFDWAEFNSNYATAAARPTIAVTLNTWTTVPLATEVGDADGNFSIAANQINIVKAGRYLFLGGQFFYQTSTVVGVFELRLRNVTQAVDLCKGLAMNGTAQNIMATIGPTWFEANASDKIELQINHTTTGTITIGVNQNSWSGSNPKAVLLSLLKVRPLT